MQADATFGRNSNGRICGANLSDATAIDAGSFEPDTAEGDTLVPIEQTSDFYSPTEYTLVSAPASAAYSSCLRTARYSACRPGPCAVLSASSIHCLQSRLAARVMSDTHIYLSRRSQQPSPTPRRLCL